MIEYFLISMLVLSVVHYVYENCVLPELRLQFIYRLFKLRDELRRAKLSGNISQKPAYRVLQDSLNNGINYVFMADYLLVSEVRHAINTNRILAKQTERRVQILDDSDDPFIQDIRRKSQKIFSYALLSGMGSWFLYLIPLAVALTSYRKLKAVVKATLAMPSTLLSNATTDRYGCEQNLALA